MKTLLVGLSVVCTLTGCALLPQASTNVATQPPEPQVSTEDTEVAPSQTPEATPSQIPDTADIQWDLYPGLKLKLDQLVSDKECAGISRIYDEFVGKTKALDDYLKKSLSSAGCELVQN